MKTRIEKDYIGERELPFDAYYGINALRAFENFQISNHKADRRLCRAIALIKAAAAKVNAENKDLDRSRAEAIIKAAREIFGEKKDADEELRKKLLDSVIIDPMQGGAGTSYNMNLNEIIANRAIEILGGNKGDYSVVHPNDHVNLSQSTNDVIPSAMKICYSFMLDEIQEELRKLFICLLEKSTEFMDIIKVGRTQMQDAVPISLGQEFFAYADAVRRGIDYIQKAKMEMIRLNLGGTAIGTGINASPEYGSKIISAVNELTGKSFVQADNLIDATQNIDCFVFVSGAIKSIAVSLSKIANDLRLMSSGPVSGFGEINLPALQCGSSIMPGKVNPVIPEIVNQVAFAILGYDQTIAHAAEGGQLELNQFLPVVAVSLGEGGTELINVIRTFREKCIQGITANEDVCRRNLEFSTATVTALCPSLGYEKSAAIAKRALAEKKTIKALVLEEGLLSKEELDAVLDPQKMVSTFNSIRVKVKDEAQTD